MIKKLPFYSLVVIVLASCGNNKQEKEMPPPLADTTQKGMPVEQTRPAKINAGIKSEDFEAGLVLVSNSDCFRCHKMNEKVIGPAFTDIANKYPINQVTLDTLSNKIIAGSVGTWGQVPMLAHTGLSKADAEKMMHYIFGLKQ